MTIPFKRPMLAASLLPSNVEHTDLLVLKAMQELYRKIPGARAATIKEDGIRGLCFNKLASRVLYKIPNLSLQKRAENKPRGLDVELCADGLPYTKIESIVMSEEHPDSDKIKFHIIDLWDKGEGIPYIGRIGRANDLCKYMPDVVPSNPAICPTAESLFLFLKECEADGKEGICWRLPDSKYVQKNTLDNRSTLAEQYLLKFSRYLRMELLIVGFKEQEENGNADKRNPLGKMKRTTNKDLMYGKNTLGSFVCQHPDGYTVDVGTGVELTADLRKEIWDNRDAYYRHPLTVKYKPFGMKDKLRSPIALMEDFKFVGKREKGF